MNEMVYVAADPEQPGAAFAIASTDMPKRDLAKTLADWVRRGGVVQHVTKDVGVEMLQKWLRVKVEKQQELL